MCEGDYREDEIVFKRSTRSSYDKANRRAAGFDVHRGFGDALDLYILAAIKWKAEEVWFFFVDEN